MQINADEPIEAVIKYSALMTEAGWRSALDAEFEKDYFKKLERFLGAENEKGAAIYPPQNKIFNAFNLTPLATVKVVIIGQDPYHGPGQAMGLSFSVPEDVKIPPSLKNIFKEIHEDIGGEMHESGDLTEWAKQGVLLLNNVLTVEKGRAAAHAKKGWEAFTRAAISTLNGQRKGVVYLLWGAHAEKKKALIDGRNNLVLCAPHPSPLSSYRGFFGCRHFSQANAYLEKSGQAAINWTP